MSTAREDILGRVKEALRDVGPDVDTPVEWTYAQPTAMDDVIARFVERVEDYRAEVRRVPRSDVPAAVVEALRSTNAASVVVPNGSPAQWSDAVRGAGVEILSDDPQLSNEQLNDAGAVLTGCRVAAAESGTIMLDHGDAQGRRALSLVPDVHVCVVDADQVVSDVPEAVARLHDSVAEHRPITWISGGSATSDIELSRVEGVHGPRTLIVIVAE